VDLKVGEKLDSWIKKKIMGFERKVCEGSVGI